MNRLLAFSIIAVLCAFFIHSPNISAAGQPEGSQTQFSLLDLSLEFDPAVKDFKGDVSIVLQDSASEQQYQYVFRQSQNYVLQDNPVKIIAGKTYEIETYIHNTTGVNVVGADGQPLKDITVPASGAKLVLLVVNGAENAGQEPEQPAARGDLGSLIPVMDNFYKNTAYAVNGDNVRNLNFWTKGSPKDRFLRDPNHTADQWDSLSLYERANYLALTIIPFDVLFTYQTSQINVNDKTSFTKTVYSDIDYLRVASNDEGRYYDEICKVLDWEWDYYVQHRDFVNVIDEYAKLKADGGAEGTTDNLEKPAAGNETEQPAASTPANTPSTAITPAVPTVKDTPAAIAAAAVNDNETPPPDSTEGIQYKLIQKIINNVPLIIVGIILILGFFGVKLWNKNRELQSEEDPNRKN